MIEVKTFQEHLYHFLETFDGVAEKYDCTVNHATQLEFTITEYSKFITSESNKDIWEQVVREDPLGFHQLLEELRKKSAICVAIMEKYRAIKFLNGKEEITDYFKNIESCIAKEFGVFQVQSQSKVLLIGSGSFPMTPLLIASQTGAEVVGIDIDDEAITLGLNVVESLGSELNIRLENTFVEDLDFTKEATHIIFSSTVDKKYEIMDQLHPLTKDDVVVAMRYGDGLKSLFNYPMKKVDGQKWKMVQNILRPEHVFDIALYKKASLV